MFNNDSLFVNYDSNQFNTYKKADLLSGDYFSFLDRALSQSVLDSENSVQKYANPIGMVVAGPYSNIAGRFRNYLVGNDNYLPADKMVHGSKMIGFKPIKTPNTKDLATAWAYETTGDILYPY